MTRVAAALVLALLPAAAAGVLGPLYGGRVQLAVPSLPRSLAPARPADAGARLTAGLVHETLVRVEDGTTVPAIAERWSAGAGGREWRLALSPRARFHDGAALGAPDVVRSLRRYLRSDSTAAAVLAERLEGGVAYRAGHGAELPGLAAADGALVLRFARAFPRPLAPLAAAAAAITGSRGDGCGPFAPAVFDPGRRLELVAAADHPLGRPFLDGVRLRLAAERASPQPLGDARPELLLLALDVTRPPFDAAGPRAAIAAAVDRETLTRRFLASARPARGLLGGPVAEPPPPAPAPWRATAAVTLAVDRNVPRAASRRVVAHLAATGLDVHVEVLPPVEARGATAEVRLLLWAPEVAESGLALRELATLTRVPPAVERSLRRAARELDADLRAEDLARAHRELLADAALIPLATLPVAVAAPDDLRGARVDASGALRLDDAWLAP